MKMKLLIILIALVFWNCAEVVSDIAAHESATADASSSGLEMDSSSSSSVALGTPSQSSIDGIEEVSSSQKLCTSAGGRPDPDCVIDQGGGTVIESSSSEILSSGQEPTTEYFPGYEPGREETYCGEFYNQSLDMAEIPAFLEGTTFAPLNTSAHAYEPLTSNVIPLNTNIAASVLPIVHWTWWNPDVGELFDEAWLTVQTSTNCEAGNVDCEVMISQTTCDKIWYSGKQDFVRTDELGTPIYQKDDAGDLVLDSSDDPILEPYTFEATPTKVEIIAKGSGYLTMRVFPYYGPDLYDNRQAAYMEMPQYAREIDSLGQRVTDSVEIEMGDGTIGVYEEWVVSDTLQPELTSEYTTYTIPINSVDIPDEITRLLALSLDTRLHAIHPLNAWDLTDPYEYNARWIMIKSVKFLKE